MSRQPTIEFCALQIRGTSHLPLLPYRSPLPKPHGIFSPEKTLRDEGGDPLGALSPPSSSGGYVEKSRFRKPWLRSRLVNLQNLLPRYFFTIGNMHVSFYSRAHGSYFIARCFGVEKWIGCELGVSVGNTPEPLRSLLTPGRCVVQMSWKRTGSLICSDFGSGRNQTWAYKLPADTRKAILWCKIWLPVAFEGLKNTTFIVEQYSKYCTIVHNWILPWIICDLI